MINGATPKDRDLRCAATRQRVRRMRVLFAEYLEIELIALTILRDCAKWVRITNTIYS